MMEPYVEEKLSLAADELKGSPNREKLFRVMARTLSAVGSDDLTDAVRERYEEVWSIVLRQGKLSHATIHRLSDEDVRRAWAALKEVCRRSLLGK